jgi:hypothetical protein
MLLIWMGGWRLVDWWIGGLVDWWIGGLVDWWIGGLVDWWIGGLADGGWWFRDCVLADAAGRLLCFGVSMVQDFFAQILQVACSNNIPTSKAP